MKAAKTIALLGNGLQGHGEGALNGSDLVGESKLAAQSKTGKASIRTHGLTRKAWPA